MSNLAGDDLDYLPLPLSVVFAEAWFSAEPLRRTADGAVAPPGETALAMFTTAIVGLLGLHGTGVRRP